MKSILPAVLPFVARLNDDDTAGWINALTQAMPNERIVPFAQLTPAQRDEARVAIVANPDPKELDALPSLQWVQSLWAGVERMLNEMRSANVGIVRLEDPQLAATMAEAVLAWTLYLHRDMPTYAAQQRTRVWRPLPFRLPSERNIALLGLGHLAECAAQKLLSAGFNVMGWSRTRKTINGVKTFAGNEELNDMLSLADIVVCLLPLTEQTRGLLSSARFANMKSNASLINFGRGAIVNTTDLLQALDHGLLSHAVLDVFDVEPLPIESTLWSHEKITVLPHISAPTHRGSASLVVAKNIAQYRTDGSIPRTVDREIGY